MREERGTSPLLSITNIELPAAIIEAYDIEMVR